MKRQSCASWQREVTMTRVNHGPCMNPLSTLSQKKITLLKPLDWKWYSSQMFWSVSTWKEHFVECMMCNACHARYDLEIIYPSSPWQVQGGRWRCAPGFHGNVAPKTCTNRGQCKEVPRGGGSGAQSYCWMEEILYQMRCINPVNNGIFTISTGAGFLPLTVWSESSFVTLM